MKLVPSVRADDDKLETVLAARRFQLLLFVVACKRPEPLIASDAGIAPTSSATTSVSALPARSPVEMQIDRWNAAHAARDASAFASLYASSVQFYGQTLSNAECVKRKMAALAKSPGYAQAVHHLTTDGGNTHMLFTKTTIEHGKSHDYVQMISFDDTMHIIEESDRTTEAALVKMKKHADDWCMDDVWMSNDRIEPPFKVSSNTAMAELGASKYLAALHAEPGLEATGGLQFDCPTSCVTTEPRKCGYNIRIENADRSSGSVSNLVQWVYVDAVTNVLWYQDFRNEDAGYPWVSEPLHP